MALPAGDLGRRRHHRVDLGAGHERGPVTRNDGETVPVPVPWLRRAAWKLAAFGAVAVSW